MNAKEKAKEFATYELVTGVSMPYERIEIGGREICRISFGEHGDAAPMVADMTCDKINEPHKKALIEAQRVGMEKAAKICDLHACTAGTHGCMALGCQKSIATKIRSEMEKLK